MKIQLCSLLTLLLLGRGALAAEDEGITRLAVIGLEANGVPAELARALSETVATRAARTGVFETVSPVQLSAVVALDKSRWATGQCAEEDCFARLARAVSAEHAIGGSVGRAGDTFVLNLVLVDVATAKAVRRTEKREGEVSALLEAAGHATIEIVQPILSERSGFAQLDANVPGAQLSIDGERTAERTGQVFPLAAGPHVVKASMDGFYPTTVDLTVRPNRVSALELTLVPAPETVKAYRSEANTLRTLAWVTAGLAVASAGASAFFYDQGTGNLDTINGYNALNDIDRAGVERPTGARSDFDTNQGLYLTFLGTAVVSGLASAGFFMFGPDPDRYAEFEDLSAGSEP